MLTEDESLFKPTSLWGCVSSSTGPQRADVAWEPQKEVCVCVCVCVCLVLLGGHASNKSIDSVIMMPAYIKPNITNHHWLIDFRKRQREGRREREKPWLPFVPAPHGPQTQA